MNLSDAADHIGQKVVYRHYPEASPEEGVITSVNERFVFVRYGADAGSKATRPGQLTLLAGDPR